MRIFERYKESLKDYLNHPKFRLVTDIVFITLAVLATVQVLLHVFNPWVFLILTSVIIIAFLTYTFIYKRKHKPKNWIYRIMTLTFIMYGACIILAKLSM